MHKLVYVATNPVKDRLVDKVHHWPSVNGLAALLGGHTLHATRPKHFFRPQGPMPAAVTLNLVLPSELGDSSQLLAELRERVAATEAAVAAERLRTGARVLGRRTILRQAWRDCPTSREPRRNLRPRLAARNQWARLEALRRNREFVAAYREARACWISGNAICVSGRHVLAPAVCIRSAGKLTYAVDKPHPVIPRAVSSRRRGVA